MMKIAIAAGVALTVGLVGGLSAASFRAPRMPDACMEYARHVETLLNTMTIQTDNLYSALRLLREGQDEAASVLEADAEELESVVTDVQPAFDAAQAECLGG